MKAYEFQISGEEEIISANTLIEALKFYKDLTGLGLDDFANEDDIYELPREKWKDYKLKHEGGAMSNVEAEMKAMPSPSLICSTVY